MTSFGWKRKAGEKLNKSVISTFINNAKEDLEVEDKDIDWLTLAPKRRAISLEDALSKSERLKAEGAVLAEAERYWEAIKKWDEALQLTPVNEKIMDMKAQALMAVGEVFPAVQAAERVVELAPTWWVGHQTLGRALVNIGEVTMALKCFSRAVHLNPTEKDVWVEDLVWAKSLLERRKLATMTEAPDGLVKCRLTVTEVEVGGACSTDNNQADHSITTYTRATTGASNFCPDLGVNQNLRSVPTNYVHMRDPT